MHLRSDRPGGLMVATIGECNSLATSYDGVDHTFGEDVRRRREEAEDRDALDESGNSLFLEEEHMWRL